MKVVVRHANTPVIPAMTTTMAVPIPANSPNVPMLARPLSLISRKNMTPAATSTMPLCASPVSGLGRSITF